MGAVRDGPGIHVRIRPGRASCDEYWNPWASWMGCLRVIQAVCRTQAYVRLASYAPAATIRHRVPGALSGGLTGAPHAEWISGAAGSRKRKRGTVIGGRRQAFAANGSGGSEASV